MAVGIQISESGTGAPDSQSTSEREEALWCEVVRLRYQLKQRDRQIALLEELTGLLKEKYEGVVRAHAPKPTVDRTQPATRTAWKLTEEQTQDVITRFKNGATVAELARAFHLTSGGVSNLLKRRRVKREVQQW